MAAERCGTAATRARRVVVLGHTARLGGAELALLRLLPELDRARFDTTVVLFEDGALRDRLEGAAIEVLVCPLDKALLQTARTELAPLRAFGAAGGLLRHAGALRRLLRELAPDLIVANTLKSGVIGGLVARSLGVPLVWHLHDRLAADYLPRPVAAAMRGAVRLLADRVVVNSAATRAALGRIPPERVVLAYPGLLPDAFEPVGRPPDQAVPTVGIIGRISPTKGQDVFLRAAARVRDAGVSARFRIVGAALFGEDAYAESLGDLIHTLGLEEHVELTGWTDDPATALRELDLLVHASPTPEPFGQVVVEAMAAGVPVIAAAAGGIPEILMPPGRARLGGLVPPGDDAALAHAIIHVLTHPDVAATVAAAARQDAADRFTIARTAREVARAWSAAAPAAASTTPPPPPRPATVPPIPTTASGLPARPAPR